MSLEVGHNRNPSSTIHFDTVILKLEKQTMNLVGNYQKVDIKLEPLNID